MDKLNVLRQLGLFTSAFYSRGWQVTKSLILALVLVFTSAALGAELPADEPPASANSSYQESSLAAYSEPPLSPFDSSSRQTNKPSMNSKLYALIEQESSVWWFIVAASSLLLLLLVCVLVLPRLIADELLARHFGSVRFRVLAFAVIAAIFALVGLLVWSTLVQNLNGTLSQVERQLRVVLQNTMERNDQWIVKHIDTMTEIGKDPELVDLTRALLEVPTDANSLRDSAELARLRQFIDSRGRQLGRIGFFIINKNYISIGSRRDSNLGTVNLIAHQRPDLLHRAFNGDSVFIPPIQSDVHLVKPDDARWRNKPMTMFFAVPIVDDDGKTIAVLTQRLVPSGYMSHIMHSGQIGNTGETYMVDRMGRMMTTSRFQGELAQLGLTLPEHAAVHPLELRDPGVNLTLGLQASLDKDDQPLTRMASSLVNLAIEMDEMASPPTHGRIITDMTGYRDYRGVPVFGAWMWEPHFETGAATKIDVDEALAEYYVLRRNLLTISIATLLFTVVATLITLIFGERVARTMRRNQIELESRVAERTRALSDSEQRLRTILDNTNDGIIVIDSEGFIQEFNPASERIFGYSYSNIAGKNVSRLMDEPFRSKHQRHIQRYLQTHQQRALNKRIEVEGRRWNGDHFPMDIAVKEAFWRGETIFIGIVRDITDSKNNEKLLHEAKVKAETADQAKSSFLANMSHEIRTPMNAIIGMSHLSLKTELSGQQRDYTEKTLEAANSLLGIINDILDFTKIEAGKMTIESVPFNLEHVMRNVTTLLSAKAHEKGLEFLICTAPKVPLALVGDPLRLGQVITNLASNAVKFTNQGEVLVQVDMVESGESDVLLRFAVEDTGQGMSKDQQRRLFKPFSQGDVSTTRRFGGTGLGLTICKHLLELMGGEISFHSELGKGSCFSFELKFNRQNTGRWKRLTVPQKMANARALIVDANTHSRKILEDLVEVYGLDYESCDAGSQALTLLQDESDDPFGLVIVDVNLNDMSGTNWLEQARANKRLDNLKIIAISSFDIEKLQQVCRSLALPEPLLKPVTASSLLDAICGAFGVQQVHSKSIHSQAARNSRRIAAIKGANILLVEDNEINQQVATELLTAAGLNVDVASNGQQALEKVTNESFDAVLMDIQMPVMDGYEASRQMRLLDRCADLPIIAMTANALLGDKEKALRAGMNEHVAKPINPDELLAKLAIWIAPKQHASQLSVPGESDNNLPANVRQFDLPGFDVSGAVARMGDDVDAYLNILQKVVATEQQAVDVIRESIKANNWQQAGDQLHSLKGVAANIGASAVYLLAAAMETTIEKGDQKGFFVQLNELAGEFSRMLSTIEQALSCAISDKQAAPSPLLSPGLSAAQQLQLTQLARRLNQQIERYDATAEGTVNLMLELPLSAHQRESLAELHSLLAHYQFTDAQAALADLDLVATRDDKEEMQ